MKLYQDTRSYLSTGITIKFFSNLGRVDSQNILDAAFHEFFRIGQTYTRFSIDSELSRLNATAGTGGPFPLNSEFAGLVEFALELAEFSGGSFDPTVIDLLEMHGYKTSFNPKLIVAEQVAVKSITSYAKKRANWEDMDFDPHHKTLELPSGVRLDLGSIGKGHAIDCAAEVLSKAGVRNFIIDAGGDIFANGQNLETDKNWSAELLVKEGDDTFSLGKYNLSQTGEALATSGSSARKVGKFHHLLDPKTGKPQNANLQAFVVAPRAIVADGLATVLFLNGENYIDKIAKDYQASCLLYTTTGKIFASDGFKIET